LEGKLEELTDKLEEQQEIRSEWERKRKRIEEETKKLQKLHSVQMQKIKKRLYEHKEREGELEDELKSTIQTKNKVEDDLHQDKRQLKSVERELASVLSDKERISNTKQLLEKRIEKTRRCHHTRERKTKC